MSNPGGTLVASAGHDVNLVGAIVANQGPSGVTSISAKNDLSQGGVVLRGGAVNLQGVQVSAAQDLAIARTRAILPIDMSETRWRPVPRSSPPFLASR